MLRKHTNMGALLYEENGTKEEDHSSPKVTSSHGQTAWIPPISQVPLPPSAALPSRPGEPGVSARGVPVHVRALVRATPLVLPTASLEHHSHLATRTQFPRAPFLPVSL